MGKQNIVNLGRVNLPFTNILRLVKEKTTNVESKFDTDSTSWYRHRNKKQLAFSKKIIDLYHPNKNVAHYYRYTNKKLAELLPKNFWSRFKMDKEKCRIDILHHAPGTVSIPHIDRYHTMMQDLKLKNDKVKREQIRRLWIPLTDTKMGHALFVGNEVAYNLKRGTVLTFDKNIVHSGCNIGYEDRYVLTVTGFYG